jgi:hypothetical protein
VLAEEFVSETLLLHSGYFNPKRYDESGRPLPPTLSTSHSIMPIGDP